MARKNIKAIYDTCRNLVKQIEENVSTGQETPQDVLDALKGAFTEIIEFEKVYLIQCQDRFYGTILMDMDIEIDFRQNGPTDLKVDRSPFILSINPLHCADYKFPEFTGLIISELLRMVYLHPASYSQINPEGDAKKHEDLEKSSSAAAATIIKRDIRLSTEEAPNNGCRLPQDAFTVSKLNDECKIRSQENMPLEYYYNILKKFKKDNSDRPGEQPQNTQVPLSTKRSGDGTPTHAWEKTDKDDVKSEIISMVSDAFNSLDDKARGNLPSSIASQIKALLAPPQIDWKQVLRKMIGSVPVPYRKTRTRLNRRQPFRSDLCGKLPKRTVNIICCFDTSGSMSDDDLEYCMNEVFNIIKVYEGSCVTVLECDAEVQRVYKAKNMSELKMKMKGRGGTWFTPAIEYINGEGNFKNNPKFPDAGKYRDALMVYFTDGYGESEIPKPKTYRNLWVVLQDEKCLSLKEPYGDVKALSKDEGWKKRRGV